MGHPPVAMAARLAPEAVAVWVERVAVDMVVGVEGGEGVVEEEEARAAVGLVDLAVDDQEVEVGWEVVG